MTSLTIQITRWLKKEAVWRLVGFVSAIVALPCYGLSSSFHYIFKEWNFWKIFFYSVFSLFVCFCCLFPKVWKLLIISDLIKTNVAFLALSITALFSYYAEKLDKGKPDPYSLISCAAFAIMSFSLSRQTQWGFEVELFTFFLTCLIVLLMDIKESLILVGVASGFALINLRRYLDKPLYELGVQDEHPVVIDVNMQQVMACIRELEQGNSNVTNMLLEHTKEYLEGKSELAGMDPNFVIDVLLLGKMDNLVQTIRLTLDDGFEEECREKYCNWRRGSLEQCLISLFGLQEINTEKGRFQEINTEKERFQEFIILSRWSKAVKVALRILFPSERRLCDRVFLGFHSVADRCFTEVCGGATVELLNSAYEVVSRNSEIVSSQWSVSQILDIFETLHDLILEFQSMFPESLRKAVMTVHYQLGEKCRDIFMRMEDNVFCSPYVNVIVRPDATHHPITRFVMNYLERTSENFRKFADGTGKSSSVSDQIERIMKRLERELQAMSKNYRYPALRHLFIMNNWKYIERRAAKLGLDLVFYQKSATIVQQNLKLYQRSSWNMVLSILKPEEDELVEVESIKHVLINEHIGFICSCQDNWLASKDLRSKKKFIIPIVDSSKISLANQQDPPVHCTIA